MKSIDSFQLTILDPLVESEMLNVLGGNGPLDPPNTYSNKCNKCDKCDKCTWFCG